MMALVAVAYAVMATPYADAFEAAAAAYDEGRYVDAIQQYEQLIREDVEAPAVFYNLGNAYYRAGHLGPAIANYERTLQLNPDHSGARENLATAIQEIPRNLERPQPPEWESSLLFWHYGLSQNASLWLAVLSWWLFWAMLALRVWKSWPYVRAIAIGAALLTAAFSVSVWSKMHPSPIAVASRNVVTVRYLPDAADPAHFELFEGDRVRLVDRRNEWLSIETATGERGWASAGDFTLVGPPYEAFDIAQAPLETMEVPMTHE